MARPGAAPRAIVGSAASQNTPPARLRPLARPLWLGQPGRLTGLSPVIAGGVLAVVLLLILIAWARRAPVVPVPDFETGVREAKRAESGYGHSAIIHSTNVEHMTHMGKEMDTTLYVKNGSCVTGLGLGGEGYLSYSVATTTGEGITTPKTFTRVRRCVMVENLRIV